ncbi:DUF4352 domain-containing protein [Paenibacillus sp. 7516]|uniref:DUF4352 domain-containing protein n=1 Tax=Paenibacillus sp. 7516 TaxID=2022549 RepID=UPI000BA5C432|nr:DUF4352 domain-containing protein [Paenibacillus sp. 7516]PAF29496.1 hypothetical protein CHI14_22065 [Paenibacillus sp. 7516]
MKNKLKKIIVVTTVLGLAQTAWLNNVLLVQAATSSSNTAQTQKAVKTLSNIPAVKLSSKSSVKLTDVNVLNQDEGKLITYTLTYTNNEKRSLQLVDYWTKVRSKGGTSYTSKLLTQDAEKKSVAAGSTLSVTYVTTVGKNVQLSNLNFEIVKWDFSKPNYESILGKINIPASYTVATPVNTVKKVRINDIPVKIKVQGLQTFSASDTSNYANVKINLHNVGYKGLENPNVKWVLRTKGGSSYPLNLNSNDTSYSVQPQESKSINYITTVPKKVKLDGAELIMVQENEAEKSVIPLATMQMPKSTSLQNTEVKVGKVHTITLEDNKGKMATSVGDVSVSQTHGNNYYTVNFKFKNTGSREVSVPKYDFSVQNKKGNDYPLSTKALDNLKLKPDEERLVRLTFSLPYDEADGTLKLVMNTPKAEDNEGTESKEIKFSYPAGTYILPKATSMQQSIGTESTLQIENGTLGVTWNSVQRLPWDNADVLSARVTLRNVSTNTLKLPQLKGMLSIDSADIADTQLLISQNSALLGPGMSLDVHLLTSLPTNLDVAQLQVALSEVVGENTSELIRLTHIGQLPQVPQVELGSNYALNTPGKKSELQVKRTLIYPGTSSDIVYTELQVKNVEDRQIDLAKLTGYYESKNGEYYKTTVKQIDYPAGPGDSALVTMWSKIPRKTVVSDMRLLIGETVGGETTDKEGAVAGKGYVDAASFELKPDQEPTLTTIKNVDVYPYIIQTRDFKASLSGGSTVNLSWNYDAVRNNELNLPESEHKLIVQLIEPTGKVFDKEIVLDKDLKEGNNQFLNWTIQDVVFEDRRSGAYTIAIYDEFQGQRIKLATQAMGFVPAVGNLPGAEQILE